MKEEQKKELQCSERGKVFHIPCSHMKYRFAEMRCIFSFCCCMVFLCASSLSPLNLRLCSDFSLSSAFVCDVATHLVPPPACPSLSALHHSTPPRPVPARARSVLFGSTCMPAKEFQSDELFRVSRKRMINGRYKRKLDVSTIDKNDNEADIVCFGRASAVAKLVGSINRSF